jgi:hypothetical protein
VGALVINWAGRIVFTSDVSFEELVRTLGLGHVFQVAVVLGILIACSAGFSGEVSVVMLIAVVMIASAWLLATKEALDLGWLQTGVAVRLGWPAYFVITTVIAGWALGLIERSRTIPSTPATVRRDLVHRGIGRTGTPGQAYG